jgi:hypothetical protein
MSEVEKPISVGARDERGDCTDSVPGHLGQNRAGRIALVIALMAAILCMGVLTAADYGMSRLASRLKDACAAGKTPSKGDLSRVDQEFRTEFAAALPMASALADWGALLLVALVASAGITGVIGLRNAGCEKKSSGTAIALVALIAAAYIGYGAAIKARMEREVPNIPSWYWSK